MTTSHRTTPRAKINPAPTVRARALITCVHSVLENIILDPTDNRLYDELDGLCWQVWEYCMEHSTTPWSWCWDRYCGCKIALSEHEPDTLF